MARMMNSSMLCQWSASERESSRSGMLLSLLLTAGGIVALGIEMDGEIILTFQR